MARIRTVKPEFWADEKLAPMAVIDRLVFLGLISMADDAGRLVDNVKSIDGFIFPETDDSARDSLDRLASAGRITRYRAASGQRLIQITHWERHQKVDKPAKYVLPENPASTSRTTRENVASVSRSDLGPRTGDQGPATEDLRPATDDDDRAAAAAAAEIPEFARDVADALPTDDDRAALATLLRRTKSPESWAASFRACLASMPGHIPATPAQLAKAVREFVANGSDDERPNAKLFAGYLRSAKSERSEKAEGGAEGGGGGTAEAGEVLAQIRALVREQYTPAAGTTRFIRKDEVKALGPDVFRAYEAIGGAARVIGTKPEHLGLLARDFASALEGARSPRRPA